ncbi:MAG: helix-turn-helix transcriptional regulator [Eubacteriales bacterium]|nr:helix-turn-helix transcriptional regulator [Eubacteriales bacterium]
MDRRYMGETLRRLRGNKTQDEVAAALEISKSALSMYEKGGRIPRDEIKKKLADYYGRSVQFIFFKQ